MLDYDSYESAGVNESIVTKNITPSNYFKIRAIGDNNQTESFSILVQLYDETPPAVPVGLTGKIDSAGIVRLEWKANTEKDLGGYHVFKSTEKNSFSTFLWHTQNIGCCIANSFNTFF